jgi:hypothetical protein
MGYRGYGLPISDLISEGNVGLMQAIKRFEPDKDRHLCRMVDHASSALLQHPRSRSQSASAGKGWPFRAFKKSAPNRARTRMAQYS